ncbi:MAG: winged helix-turn-helix transcriptional regulator [Hydrogenophaga sp.]|uniref:Winged helix-turn-helix transcriptional regulator n=1 Tax=Hydrogenophaga crocea TaxID=2716225 RepID=A0A6G8ID65_9BURK|nr:MULTISPECIES: MarR family winged helix-turn-helix transcriptional regulator [Hydrogenophaga]MBL0945334.1 winged helix-turn-helix transcriptional regulator [Hydrogenophaga sp.]QIM51069.1 winged helix-turn-helix transcriptional regulator [Hydrogenophaga crocea]
MSAVTPASSSPPAVRPQGCTNFKLRQLVRVVGAHYDAEVGKTGLKTTQYTLLSHITKLGPIRAVELAQQMHMSASTLSRNLRPLIEAGWVEQAPGPDARSWFIQATPEGQAKRSEAQRRWRAAQEALNARLGPERVVALHALIDESLQILDEEGAGHGLE